MKQKKTIAVVIAVIVLACIGLSACSHQHTFSEWEALTPADCENAAVEVRRCECGEEETREGEPATGHSFVSISAKCLLETPMESMVLEASDLLVTGTCGCGAEVELTEGVELAGAALALGENTVTVKYGELSTELTIQAEKLDIALDGVICDDTYVASGSKDKEHSEKKDMGTSSDMYRIYFRADLSEILATEMFAANKDNAKVQLLLSVTGGSVTEETVFTLKAFDPTLPEADTAFSELTWNSVDNKDGALGAYTKLHWSNGTQLLSEGTGYQISEAEDRITITLAYSQIADFVGEDGWILFAFATNEKSLKVGSLENKTESNHPAIKVILNDEHFHVFDQKSTAAKYLVSAKCKEKAKYHLSCVCGEAGTETFTSGGTIAHRYGALVAKVERTCTSDGMREHYRCTACGKYFIEKDGNKVVTSAASLKIEAGHNCGKLIAQKDATCAADGLKAHYQCARCKKYFVEVNGERVETTKEALKISKLEHTFSDLVPKQEKTCTSDGMKSHYRCTVCGKYFVEKDGKKVATSEASLKIPADHKYGKLIAQKDPTCKEEGMKAHYRCDICKKYFVEVDGKKVETTKEDLIIPASGHSYGDLVPRKEPTCTSDGMKAHWRCAVCGKYFVEKNGEKVATSEKSLKISAGHDMAMKWDDESHWSECRRGCGHRTEPEAHSGGTATETEQAKCQVCGQPYGALKTGILWFLSLLK